MHLSYNLFIFNNNFLYYFLADANEIECEVDIDFGSEEVVMYDEMKSEIE